MVRFLACLAMDAAAPMLTGIVRPGLIFVLCRHRGIFAVANGACACLPAVHAGAGLRLGVAGVVFAGAGVGAVAVGRPIVPVVIQCVQSLIRSVIAALTLAGFVGFPARLGAGGSFGIVIIQIMIVHIYCAAFKGIR